MIENLFHVALRNLIKDGWFSLLNILGLTIGITFSLFLIFYVRDELSYDRYNENAGRICRIVSYVFMKKIRIATGRSPHFRLARL